MDTSSVRTFSLLLPYLVKHQRRVGSTNIERSGQEVELPLSEFLLVDIRTRCKVMVKNQTAPPKDGLMGAG